MKVGIISQSPTLTTGFGVTTKVIADYLYKAKCKVACFGIDQIGETFDRNSYPYSIWTVGGLDLAKTFKSYLSFFKPDLLIVNFDIMNVGRWYAIIQASGYKGKLYAHMVLDGTPFLMADLRFLNEFARIIVPTRHTQNYLISKNILNVAYAHHGVNTDFFHPISNKEFLKKSIGISNKKIIGCFARNTERKQQAKILQAISILVNDLKFTDFVFYFHCNPLDHLNSWNLISIAKELDIEEYVYFPKDLTDQLRGTPLNDSLHSNGITRIEDLSLVQRIGICDLCVNIPFCGGFELLNLEVQACGIPLIGTDDKGNMAEILTQGSVLIEASEVQIWKTGAYQYLVNARMLAQNVYNLMFDEASLQALSQAALQNAKQFSWKYLEKELDLVIKTAAL
ncbi:hypothetical protein [Sediminibacterium sp.]|uniref:hypothetical protein n=1 Tax=Sediminibacterium sp. TaxID=1917865 RepID=UPI003F702577